jgi:hypothetical protein
VKTIGSADLEDDAGIFVNLYIYLLRMAGKDFRRERTDSAS